MKAIPTEQSKGEGTKSRAGFAGPSSSKSAAKTSNKQVDPRLEIAKASIRGVKSSGSRFKVLEEDTETDMESEGMD